MSSTPWQTHTMADMRVCAWAHFYCHTHTQIKLWYLCVFQLWMNILVTIQIAHNANAFNQKTVHFINFNISNMWSYRSWQCHRFFFLLLPPMFRVTWNLSLLAWYLYDKLKCDIWYIRCGHHLLRLWKIMCSAFNCWIDFWSTELSVCVYVLARAGILMSTLALNSQIKSIFYDYIFLIKKRSQTWIPQTKSWYLENFNIQFVEITAVSIELP